MFMTLKGAKSQAYLPGNEIGDYNSLNWGMEVFVDDLPTRYVSSFVVDFISDFMHFCVEKYGFSTEEISIICVVTSESTREIRTDAYLLKTYGTETSALPDNFRFPVSVKFVCNRLGTRRETTRRKLEDLVNRGFLSKNKGGYTLPAQTGAADYTKDLRNFFVLKMRGIQHFIENIPA